MSIVRKYSILKNLYQNIGGTYNEKITGNEPRASVESKDWSS